MVTASSFRSKQLDLKMHFKLRIHFHCLERKTLKLANFEIMFFSSKHQRGEA